MNSTTCGRCGWELRLPPLDEACLDERGASHVVCAACGTENAFASMELIDPPSRVRSFGRGSGAVGLLMWLLIFGMLLLMLPSFQVIAPRPAEPPRYMLT